MPTKPTRLDASAVAPAVVAALACALPPWLCPSTARAVEPNAGARAATLSVSASVVRGCALATPAVLVVGEGAGVQAIAAKVGAAVSLHCSAGVAAALRVGPPSPESAAFAQLDREAAAFAGSSAPVVVTVLF